MACVYLISFPNSKQYVGMTRRSAEDRYAEHVRNAILGGKTPLSCALRKYGKENVSLNVLARGLTTEAAAEFEIDQIRLLCTTIPYGYNVTSGGEGLRDYMPSEETRQKLSLASKRVWESESYRDKILPGLLENAVKANKNRPLSREHKDKIRQANIGKKRSPETRQRMKESNFRHRRHLAREM